MNETPGSRDALTDITAKIPRNIYGNVDISRKVPLETSECFNGREEELDRMLQHTRVCYSPAMESRVIFVSGMPGIGKTSLVTEFCRTLTKDGFKRLWISCRGISSVVSIQELLLRTFGITSESSDGFEQLFNKLCYLNQETNWVVVMDSVQDVILADTEKFNKFVCQLMSVWGKVNNSSCCLLLTCWNQASADLREQLQSDILCVNLNRMTDRESLKLIDSYLGKKVLSLDEKMSLMESCGHHPLAMELVARHISCSSDIAFSGIEAALKNHHRIYDCVLPADKQASIGGSLLHAFHSLDEPSKDLLVRLLHAAESVKRIVIEKLFKNAPDGHGKTIDKSLEQLTERNLVKGSWSEYFENDTIHYSLYPLVKSFLRVFCESDPRCPSTLKKAFDESRELLLDAYRQEMVELSAEETRGSRRVKELSRAIVSDRKNFAAQLPAVLDFMARKNCSIKDFELVCQFRSHLISNRMLVANFFLERLKAAERNNAPGWVLLFFELYFADAIRMAGDYQQALESFDRVSERLRSCDERGRMEDMYLRALYLRFKGRHLKDLGDGAEEAIKLFKDAEEIFKDATLFPDVQSALAPLYFDTGNAYKKLADQQWPEGKESLKLAKSYFEKVNQIYRKNDDKMPRLFEVHLALATCEMELKSGLLPLEDKTTLDAALKHYEEAVKVADHNGELIHSSEARMGDLFFSRAICYLRARDCQSALIDARQALALRISVFGYHAKTARAFILLGRVCLEDRDRKIKDNRRRAQEFFKSAFKLIRLLAMKDAFDDELWRDLPDLESYLISAMDSAKEYTSVLKAIKDNDRSKFEYDASMDHDEDIFNYSDVEYKESSSDSDSCKEDSKVRSPGEARDLGAKLQSLIETNVERLRYVMDQTEIERMEDIAEYLQYHYRDKSKFNCDEIKIKKFRKGEKSIDRLKQLENYEPSFLATHAVLLAGIVAAFLAFICCMCKIYL